MPGKPRDYKAEYRRRIAKGQAKGMSRGQAAGHPSAGEMKASQFHFYNPFREMKGVVSRMVSSVQNIMGLMPKKAKEHEVEYVNMHDMSGILVLPRWSVGDEDDQPTMSDVQALWFEASDLRYQSSYNVVVCGELEEEYPGHEGERVVCLSYRITRGRARAAFENRENHDTEDLVNDLIPRDRTNPSAQVTWDKVYMVQIVDKD